MGKKGSWFSAIKRVFAPSSKDKPPHDSEKVSAKEKKGRGKQKHGDTKSFIPLFREPSSIEKILGEAEELFRHPSTSSQQPRVSSTLPGPVSPHPFSYRVTSPRATSPRITSPKASYRVISPKATSPKPSSRWVTSPKAASQRFTSPRPVSPPRLSSPKATRNHAEISYAYRPVPTLRTLLLSATKIQAAYRGYIARRSYRALRGLVRLQGVVRSSNVKKQTVNAMRQMQLLVRVQTQIQSRRIQMLENQALQNQALGNEKEDITSKWTQLCEAGNQDDWDDSVLTKEEVETRLRKKVEAVIKRERAMAYAYSHQLWKSDPISALEMGASGFPWWWNWLERQLPSGNDHKKSPSIVKDIHLTPPRLIPEQKPSPQPPSTSFRRLLSDYDNLESVTPQVKQMMHTPSPMNSRTSLKKYSRNRASAATSSPFDLPLKDDDSLTSCPPFSVPHYMAPTVSAKAKVRANSNPKERNSGNPSNADSKRRFSFPLTPNIWSSKWSKGSGKDSSSRKQVDKHETVPDHISVDSTVSMPARVGRKPFNRFV